MINETETDIYNDNKTVEVSEDGMIFKKGGKTYYTKKSEALAIRRKGDRIYYNADEKAYYIVRPQKRSFWGF